MAGGKEISGFFDAPEIALLLREIDQESDRKPGRFQAGTDLCVIRLAQVLHRLQFQDHRVVDYQIQSMPTDELSLVGDRHFLFARDREPALP